MRGGAQAGCWAECRVGCGAKRGAGGEGGVRWEEAKKMACEITSDAILPI